MLVVPSPSWPDVLDPQHQAAPPSVKAQVWYRVELKLANDTPAGITTGTGTRRFVVVPSPI